MSGTDVAVAALALVPAEPPPPLPQAAALWDEHGFALTGPQVGAILAGIVVLSTLAGLLT